MNKRKILSLAMALSIVAIMAVGATLAYFTDTENAANTFELGGVDIDLIERAYVDGKWQDITPNATTGVAELGKLQPQVIDWYNKNVFTINNEDEAYIRNYVAIEVSRALPAGEGLGKETDMYEMYYNNAAMANPSEGGLKRHGAVLTALYDNVVIGDKMFDIHVFDTIDNEPVATGDSFGTLTTVYLTKNATNEDMEVLAPTLEVYTFSEAIQSAGLTHEDAMKTLMGDDADLQAHAIKVISGLIK